MSVVDVMRSEGIIAIGQGFCFSQKRLFVYSDGSELTVPVKDIESVYVYKRNSWGVFALLAATAAILLTLNMFLWSVVAFVLAALWFKFVHQDHIFVYQRDAPEPHYLSVSRRQSIEIFDRLKKLNQFEVEYR